MVATVKTQSVQHYYHQFQVVIEANPGRTMQELYLGLLNHIGVDPKVHDVPLLSKDNWESPTLGAWGAGLGSLAETAWKSDPVTYFPAGRGVEC